MILMDSVPRLAPLLPADSARTVEVILRESGVVPSRSIQMMRRPSAAWLYRTAEAFLGRGQLLWFGLRKRWFAELVEESIASGARQLLVLGSGFDPLALITARKHPAVLCVEIDASPTAGPKRYGIDRAGLAVPNHFVSASDLSLTPLEEVLSSTPWSAEVPSVVIAEGLLMYLRREHVIDLLGKIRRSCGRGSRFAFTALDVDDAGRPRLVFSGKLLGRVIRAAVRSVGEDMHWGTAPRALPAFLDAAGFRVLDQPDLPGLRRRLLAPIGLQEEPIAPYEHLCLAELSTTPVPTRHPSNRTL
ncbi:MAG TPA: class I SAM-dependent methyltransferase [Myxococcaceae bacterium]|nr:class I SAM-dependent methyltransferase [Myxococcaceae bacterium]